MAWSTSVNSIPTKGHPTWAEPFTHLVSFHNHDPLFREVLLSFPFHRWGIRGSKQLRNCIVGIHTKVCLIPDAVLSMPCEADGDLVIMRETTGG